MGLTHERAFYKIDISRPASLFKHATIKSSVPNLAHASLETAVQAASFLEFGRIHISDSTKLAPKRWRRSTETLTAINASTLMEGFKAVLYNLVTDPERGQVTPEFKEFLIDWLR